MQKSIIVALVILLTSCTPLSVAPASIRDVVATSSFIQTSVPISTETPPPSATHTDVPYSPEPYPESLFTEQLNSLVLIPDDIPPLDPNYPQLADPGVQDLSNKIENCANDCVKVVWKSKKVEGVGDKQVYITLIRLEWRPICKPQKALSQVGMSFPKLNQAQSLKKAL